MVKGEINQIMDCFNSLAQAFEDLYNVCLELNENENRPPYITNIQMDHRLRLLQNYSFIFKSITLNKDSDFIQIIDHYSKSIAYFHRQFEDAFIGLPEYGEKVLYQIKKIRAESLQLNQIKNKLIENK